MRTKKWKIMLVVLWLGIACTCPAKIIYVDDDAPPAGDGSSWANAYKYLQDALADANSSAKPVEIRVACGTYRPDEDTLHPEGSGEKEATFQLINGVTLKGGYAGFGQPDPDERSIGAYATILSGDLDEDDNLDGEVRGINSCSVVTGSAADQSAVLDGFAIIRSNDYPANRCESRRGGGMYILHGSPRLANCSFSRNRPGMWNEFAAPTLTDCTFNNNYNGMYNSESSPELLNCAFYENRHSGMWNEFATPKLTDCTFKNNYEGIYNSESSPELLNCAFYENRDSGMINRDNSHPILTMCEFSYNEANLGGAGLLNENSSCTLIACMFYYNEAFSGDGGGICNYSSNVKLTACEFVGNWAYWYGGAISNNDSNMVLSDCTFKDNVADVTGGGVDSLDSNLKLMNCTFNGNVVDEGGGAGMWNRYCNVELANCSFSGNVVGSRSGTAGGGIANIDGGDMKLTNCTFAANWAPNGRALACYSRETAYPSDVEISNCILWDGGDEIWNQNESAVTITHSNVQGGWAGYSGGIGNITADPCFVEDGYWEPPADFNDYWWYRSRTWVDGDYHLKSQAGRWDPNEGRWTTDDVTSPCIDAGNPMSPIGLEPFPNGGIVNMGAYGGTVEASKSYFGGPPCEIIVAGDINGDCKINFLDFQLMALHWCENHIP